MIILYVLALIFLPALAPIILAIMAAAMTALSVVISILMPVVLAFSELLMQILGCCVAALYDCIVYLFKYMSKQIGGNNKC